MENQGATTPKNKKPRSWNVFSRPADPPAYRLQPRDIKIIEAVFRHRFLSCSHLRLLLDESPGSRLDARCRLLWQDGYLERPKALRPTKILTEEIIYSLGKKGAQLLMELKIKGESFLDYLKPDTDIGELDWGESPKKQIGWPYIDHQLGVATFMVCLQTAAQDNEINVYWDGHFNRRDHIIKTKAPFQNPKTGQHYFANVNLLPDAYFKINVPGRGTAHHFLEYDRGSVSLKRMKERYINYFNYWKNDVDKRAFKHFRVLTITEDPDYMNSLRRTAATVGVDQRYSKAWKALLFTNKTKFDLNNYRNALGPIWYYPDEEEAINLI